MDEAQYCFIKFKYIYNNEKDEDVRVVGNIDALGHWKTDKAIKLSLNPKLIGVWKTKEKIKIPLSFNLEYKYLMFKNNNFSKWEYISNNKNRTLQMVDSNGPFVILDKPNELTHQIKREIIDKKKIEKKPKKKKLIKKTEKNEESDEKNGNKIIMKEPELDKDEYQDLNYDSTVEEKKESSKKSNEGLSFKKVDITDEDEILMCSFYLPLNIEKNENGNFNLIPTNDALYHTLYRITKDKKNIKWFGSLKNEKNLSNIEREEIKKKLEEKNMYLLDIDKELYTKLIELFEGIIDPFVHYVSPDPSLREDATRYITLANAYKDYNDFICKTLLKYISIKSIIYLHDYQFFLVPSKLYSIAKYNTKYNTKYINDLLSNLGIGLFMHSPFPSFDVFKTLLHREEIVKSLLKCRVLGFHTFDSSRNFLKTAKKLLSINLVSTNDGEIAASYLENNTLIRVKNVSPEIDLIENDIKSQEFKNYYDDLIKKYGHKQIFVSTDHMKFLLSIKNKLEGYRKFLKSIGGNANKNVFLLYIRYSNDEIDENGNLVLDEQQKMMIEKIDNLTNEIKREFGDDVIELYKGIVSYKHRLALFACSDCFVRTSKKESYSLGLYEFLIIKKLLKKEKNIAYMVSELSGVNTSMGGTIKINPFDYNSIKEGFLNASRQLSSDNNSEQNLAKIENDYQHVMKSSFKDWFYSFLIDIKNTKLSDDNTFYMETDEGFNFKLTKINQNFKKLELKKISLNYKNAHNRLLFFDYEGTLPSTYSNEYEDEFVSKGSKPTDEIIGLLNELTKDKRNKIFIVAEKGEEQINEWFGEVNNLGLAAEYGFKYTVNEISKKKWTKIIENYNNEWIESCVRIISPYTERYEGSYLEIKESAVVWYYTDCDQELGKSFASILSSELESLVKEYNLKIVNGKGFIEVIVLGINKGYFISYILKKQIKKGRTPDFILCIGDDFSDEKMFDYLNRKEVEINKYCGKDVILYPITVGKKPSKAKYYVDNPKIVKEIINIFVKNTQKSSSSISTSEIRKSNLKNKYNIINESEKNQ